MPALRSPVYSRPPIGPRRGESIVDLILRRGDIGAQRAAQSGQLWGNAIANIGTIAASAAQQMGEQKRTDERSAALTALAASDIWSQNPQAGFSEAVRILGPEQGPMFARGLMATMEVAARPDPGVAQKNLPFIAGGWLAATPETRRDLYPVLRDTLVNAQVGTADQWPAEWDEQMLPQVEQLVSGFAPEQKPEGQVIKTVGPEGQPIKRFVPQSELEAGVPAYQKPEPTLGSKVAEATALTEARERVQQKYAGAKETKEASKKAEQFKSAVPVINAVSELSQRINTLQGVVAKAAGTAARAQAQLNLNDDVAEYQSLVMGFTPLVARALGHTGVLTEQDVVSVRSLFPKPEDSKSLRDRKVNRLKSIMLQMPGIEAGAFEDASEQGQDEVSSDMESLLSEFGY